jgi:hypothetical protein
MPDLDQIKQGEQGVRDRQGVAESLPSLGFVMNGRVTFSLPRSTT